MSMSCWNIAGGKWVTEFYHATIQIQMFLLAHSCNQAYNEVQIIKGEILC